MEIKPILFNTEMVRAILGERKNCTRRIVKGSIPDDPKWGYTAFTPKGYISCRGIFANVYGETFFRLPYQPGDTLYVRETWQYLYELDGNEQVIEDTGKYYYAATDTIPFNTYVDKNGVGHDHAPWRPSIHMPKEAARIWLKVTDVRVERLQDITDDGAKAEGANCKDGKNVGWQEKQRRTAIERFSEIWESTVSKEKIDSCSWAANPWVWVIEFERCEKMQEEHK